MERENSSNFEDDGMSWNLKNWPFNTTIFSPCIWAKWTINIHLYNPKNISRAIFQSNFQYSLETIMFERGDFKQHLYTMNYCYCFHWIIKENWDEYIVLGGTTKTQHWKF